MNNPDRVAFSLFGRDIYWYGVLMAAGILCAVLLAMREAKRKQMHEDTVLDLCLVLIPCGVVGARLYYVLFELKQYLADPIRMLYIWEGGLAIYGAVIGGLLGMVIYAKKKKIRFLKLADIIAPGLVLAQAIGRWGNFFNQEAFGLPVTDPNLLWFPLTVKIDVPWNGGYHTFNGVACDNPYHLATFFYESMWCVLVFLFLWFFFRKLAKHDGDVFIWYVMLYSFERMFVEGLRGDSLWLIQDVVRVSQLLSFLLFAGTLVFLLIRRSREKKLGRLIWPVQEEAVELAVETAILASEEGKKAAAEKDEPLDDPKANQEEASEENTEDAVNSGNAEENDVSQADDASDAEPSADAPEKAGGEPEEGGPRP